ncbi:hypothetical protein [Enterovirga aerilata]|uniref:Uncharacterized protein n=1 Tax=Enterovirga aerilata TaxID=2730920 RepID=A0A849ICV9_9HYPH|nr:hypothetical protein [Enterovirga sp. DB1703]NNM75238.1 hypothetical protein [Enterovirga sp. DB1703]
MIDLSDRIRARDRRQAGRRQTPETVAYSLFLVVSRVAELRDHDLFYLFLEGTPTMVAAAAFARDHADILGSDIAVVDLREHFADPMEVLETARRLQETAPGATVLAPGLGLGPRLAGNG